MQQLKKLLFILAVLSSSALKAFAGNGFSQVLIVELTNGDKMMFELAEKPIVTFNAEYVNISTPNFKAEPIAYKKVSTIYFKDNIFTEIEPTPENNRRIVFRYTDNERVEIIGAEPDAVVSIFAMTGGQVNAGIARSREKITVSLVALATGFYIIKVDNQSYKIYKR